MSNIEIISLNTSSKKDIKKFVNFPFKLYNKEDNWAPQLKIDQKKYLLKGPYSEPGVVVIQPFLAYKDNKSVGRIIAHYNQEYNKQKNEKKGLIGFFDSENDTEVSTALFQSAEDWLKEHEMTSMHGPLNFLIYTPSGVLINGFEAEPALELSYNDTYYQELFENFADGY